ncbi:type II toxin-antitoxin system HicA family toxin [bacterium]|nr:type II toxin-antitoxin system HicA family toxin [bacterium]MBU1599002.1 type II toxin-antitoxin system HicA family toxin [bacterium]MBU2461433.1 type II toxin-antitoxin system HicA family toxin [bacterium]
MSLLSPCKRREFICKLCKLGFSGPFVGRKHHFMIYKEYRLAIPSNREYSIPQLKMMLGEIESILERRIVTEEWCNL